MSTKAKIALILGFLVSLTLVVYGHGSALAEKSVHHQDCPAGWTQIVDQPPYEGFSVTAAYSGTLWIKVATIHFEVPVVTKGDVITPNEVSSWPTNKNGKYQEISHVDYCIPPETTTTTTTTVPQDTTTTTTVPQDTTTTTTEHCSTGVVNEFGGCEPVGSSGETVPDTTTTPTIMRLPDTGGEAGYLAWIAAILLVGGISLAFAARRNRNL